MPDRPRFDLEAAGTALVVKPSSLGDVIHTLPAVTRLHQARPDLAIDWVVNTEWAPLLAGNPALRNVIPMPRREWRGWRDLPRAGRWARETLGPLRPDLVLDFQGLLRSALLTRAAKGGHAVGFRQAREGAPLFYDQRVAIPRWEHTHAVDRYLALVEAVGVAPASGEAIAADPAALFPLPGGEPVTLPPGSPAEGRPYVLLHPFSRGRGKSMSFAEVADFCRGLGEIPVVLVGAGMSWPEGSGTESRPENLVDLLDRTSLAQLIWLMRRAGYIVSVDSGPMHLAAAITGDLLSLHTWTDPLMVGPWRRDAWVWRDGFLGRVGDIAPGQLPERRGDRDRYLDGILPGGEAVERLAAFVGDRLRDASRETR